MHEELIGVSAVVAGYGLLTILDGLSFSARAGEITTLAGPNGAGKSTVLKTIFGLVRPSAGKIALAGEDVTGKAPRALLARGAVFVPQGRNLFPRLTVRQNLELGGITIRDKRLLQQRMDAALEQFPRLVQRIDAQASTLSGGEQKQLEIGRALLLEPKVLLIDEPSIGLAPKVIADVFRLLRRLADAGVAVLMVEQNVKSALAVSDRAIVLEGGRVALQGEASSIATDPRLGSLLLGGPIGQRAASPPA